MSLPDEASAKSDVARHNAELLAKAERLHNAAVEILTRGQLVVTKPAGANHGVVILAASLMTKAAKTFRSIQLTTEAGLGQDASVLARQLFETSVAVGFLFANDTRDETVKRAAMLGAHEDQRQLVLVEEAAKVKGLESIGSPELIGKAKQKVDAWESVIPKDVIASVRRHWSGSSLEAAAKEAGLTFGYALLYRTTSAFAHGSDINAHFIAQSADSVPTLKLSPGNDQVAEVLNASMILMRILFGTVNDSLGLGEDAAIQRMSAEVPPLPSQS